MVESPPTESINQRPLFQQVLSSGRVSKCSMYALHTHIPMPIHTYIRILKRHFEAWKIGAEHATLWLPKKWVQSVRVVWVAVKPLLRRREKHIFYLRPKCELGMRTIT